ncbi:hypothetical protein BKA70DRAFT_1522227 [Coprinopsis sp. MPI-PUGE-AT-0042]|nr:hypothetical protein BKA70DRAFT_1522227 [Coprinopsis sp. MPI-PUGE-AT-0042]
MACHIHWVIHVPPANALPQALRLYQHGTSINRRMACSSIEEARRLLDARVLALEKEILDIKSQRNQLAPIARIPLEVLTEIFFECATNLWPMHQRSQHGLNIDLTYTKWTVVSHVCRQWRDVALGCSELWSLLSPCMPKRWIEAMVERSKASPISVVNLEYEIAGLRPERFPNNIQALLTALSATSRWRSVHLRLTHRSDDITKLIPSLNSPNPSLITFSLKVDTRRYGHNLGSLPSDFLGGTAPSLRHLSLEHCQLPWGSSLLHQGLTSLTLVNPPLSKSVTGEHPLCPSAHEFAAVLARLPLLTTLELNMKLPDLGALGRVGTTFEFPSLHNLRLIGECGELAGLFSCLRIPPTTSAQIRCAKASSLSLLSLGRNLERAWTSKPIITDVHWDNNTDIGNSWSAEIYAGTSGHAVSEIAIIMVRADHWYPSRDSPTNFPHPRNLLGLLSWDHVETVSLVNAFGYGAQDVQWNKIFEGMRRVKYLTLVREPAQEFVNALMHFTKPQAISRSAARPARIVPFPQLEKLEIHLCKVIAYAKTLSSYPPEHDDRLLIIALDDIARCLRQRFALGGSNINEVLFEACWGFSPEIKAILQKLQNRNVAEKVHHMACDE